MVTLQDYAIFLRRAEKTKRFGTIVAAQAQTNRLFEVLPIKQCNQNSEEIVPLQGDLPEIAWRIIPRSTKSRFFVEKLTRNSYFDKMKLLLGVIIAGQFSPRENDRRMKGAFQE